MIDCDMGDDPMSPDYTLTHDVEEEQKELTIDEIFEREFNNKYQFIHTGKEDNCDLCSVGNGDDCEKFGCTNGYFKKK